MIMKNKTTKLKNKEVKNNKNLNIKKTKNVKTKTEKELNNLRNRYKKLIKEMKDIEKENEKIIESGIVSESSANDLPLQSLADFYNFDKEKIINNLFLKNLKRNGILKKEFIKKEEELIFISDEIKIKTIQILIEKIKILEDSLK